MSRTRIRATTALSAGLMLAGCAVGPNFKPSPPPATAGYADLAGPLAPSAVAGAAPVRWAGVENGAWWSAFGSPELDALVRQALASNPDGEAARAALRSAEELYRAQRGGLFPQASAQFVPTRNKSSADLSPVPNANVFTYDLLTYEGTLSYALDIFGGVRRSVEAAKAGAEQARFQKEAAYNTLTANLVNAALQFSAARAQLQALHAQEAALLEIVQLLQLQRDRGQAAALDFLAVRTQLLQAQASIPPVEKALAAARDAVAALTARTPAETAGLALPFDGFAAPARPPPSLPADLVRQRPDLRAAEANVHQAAAEVGVAIANRLPSLTLTASGGGESLRIGRLLTTPDTIWSLGANASTVLLDGGTLRHRQRAAEASLVQAQAQYRSTLLAAFQNVSDALSAAQADDHGVEAAASAQTTAASATRITDLQRSYGQVSRLPVLTAQAAQAQADAAVITARAAVLQDTVALYVALGGRWWDRPVG